MVESKYIKESNSIELTNTSSDKSLEYKLVYLRKGKNTYHRKHGKSSTICTQCLVFVNGLLVGWDQIELHDADADNPKFAYTLVTKKIIHHIGFKSMRKELWDHLFKLLKELKF